VRNGLRPDYKCYCNMGDASRNTLPMPGRRCREQSQRKVRLLPWSTFSNLLSGSLSDQDTATFQFSSRGFLPWRFSDAAARYARQSCARPTSENLVWGSRCQEGFSFFSSLSSPILLFGPRRVPMLPPRPLVARAGARSDGTCDTPATKSEASSPLVLR
jgi:hypothetical protein